MKLLIPFCTALSLSGCSLVTTPVKLAGKAAVTTVKVTGKVAKAGVGLMTRDEDGEANPTDQEDQE